MAETLNSLDSINIFIFCYVNGVAFKALTSQVPVCTADEQCITYITHYNGWGSLYIGHLDGENQLCGNSLR